MSVIIAETANAASLHWWQIVTEVLAIPTLIVGLVYTIVKIQKTRAETAKLTGEVFTQRQELDKITEFLHDKFVTEAELRHLEGLESKNPYPFKRAPYSDGELRRLRALDLIQIRTMVGKLPPHISDLHDHANITQHGLDYLATRRERTPKPGA